MKTKKQLPFTLMLAALSSFAGQAIAEQRTWTLDADFDQGTLINLNHDSVHDQIQLYDGDIKPFRFINIPASARGTVIRVNTDTGEIVGEYKTAPNLRGLSPSRTTVDIRGNVWAGNRGEVEGGSGSAVKIGIVVGGTRCDKDGSPNSEGDYVKLEPDNLTYNTCVDRDGDGLIRTSRKLGDILDWPDITDGVGGADGIVEDAVDECILIYQRLPGAPGIRHVSVDRENNVWVGGHPPDEDGHYYPTMFHKMNGDTGTIVASFDASEKTGFGCGGYGGTIVNNNFDQILGNDILWSASVYQDKLLRYDLSTGEGRCIDVEGSYGIGIDNNGFIWNNMHWPSTITKINPDTGSYEPDFPVDTGGTAPRGVAVTADNTVWSANTNSNTVTRLDSNGNLLATIEVGTAPTGLTVDKAGKIWVTNRDSDNIMRIDPVTNAYDLTVPLGAGAGPYTYSDMTGIVRLSHPPIGFWDVVYDGGCNTLWDRISWNGQENAATGSEIKMEARAAATKAGLAAAPFQTVSNGADLSGMRGRFMEVRATLTSEAPIGQRNFPVLSDLTIEHHPLTMTVNIPDQKYSFGFPPLDLDDYISFNPAGNWFNDVAWSYSPVPAGWSVNIDANHVAAVSSPADETNDVPITFSARLAWDDETCAVGDEAVFIANHPPVLCQAPTFQCLQQNNKKMVDKPLTGFVCDPDGDAVTVRITSITSDEPTGGEADASGIGTDTAWLRQERNARDDGRVYVVTFVAADGRGGETTLSIPFAVPHDRRGGLCNAVDSGQRYDATQPSGGRR